MNWVKMMNKILKILIVIIFHKNEESLVVGMANLYQSSKDASGLDKD